jgi:hypothetical protein
VTFKPSAAGTRTGTLSFTDNAAGSPQTVALSGTGEDFNLGAANGSSTSASVAPGGTASYTLSVTPQNGLSGTISLSCAGAPSKASCSLSPASVSLSSSAAKVTVKVSTASAALALRRWDLPSGSRPARPLPWLFWAIALALSACLARVHERGVRPGRVRAGAGWTARTALLLALLTAVSCGGSGGSSGDGSPSSISPQNTSAGTPAGSYTLTVTGSYGSSSSGPSHSLTLTLQVT